MFSRLPVGFRNHGGSEVFANLRLKRWKDIIAIDQEKTFRVNCLDL